MTDKVLYSREELQKHIEQLYALIKTTRDMIVRLEVKVEKHDYWFNKLEEWIQEQKQSRSPNTGDAIQ